MEGKVGLRDKIILGIIALLLVTGGIWRSGQFGTKGTELIQAGYIEDLSSDDDEPVLITIHVVGAVINPGIYQLPVGSRVYELISLCGGFSDEADQDTLNQARPLLDGEQILIQKIGEAPQRSLTNEPSKININQAAASDLTVLPGIGEIRAGQIIAHRDKHGFFKDIREIMDVSGIGEKTFENIMDLITIY